MTVGVVILGVYEIGAGRLTTGALIACSILAGRAMAPLAQVAGVLNRYHQARAALERLDTVMALPVERPATGASCTGRRSRARSSSSTSPSPTRARTCRRWPTCRSGSPPASGSAWSGGSAPARPRSRSCCSGLYAPDSGAVLVDGTELRQIDPADLRRNIGCVPQDLYLFQGTLRENIALAAPHADDDAVLRAARVAGVEEFAARHPMGYDLVVGERGEALSGGQRQAIAIARALLQDPPILVLDEPTSFMDNAAESRFKARLAAELDGRTLVLITHRLSLLTLVDRLIVLDAGRVVADGPREEVLKLLAEGQLRGRT